MAVHVSCRDKPAGSLCAAQRRPLPPPSGLQAGRTEYKQDHGGWICVRRSQGRPVAPDIPMRKSKMVMSMTSRMRWLLS